MDTDIARLLPPHPFFIFRAIHILGAAPFASHRRASPILLTASAVSMLVGNRLTLTYERGWTVLTLEWGPQPVIDTKYVGTARYAGGKVTDAEGADESSSSIPGECMERRAVLRWRRGRYEGRSLKVAVMLCCLRYVVALFSFIISPKMSF